MKKIFFITIFLIFSLTQKSYGYSNDPKQFISEIVEEAKAILVESNTKEFKTRKLSEMALKTVDIKGIAYYSLGKYRKKLNDEQLKEYMSLFEKYFLKSFTSRLTDYSDPKIEVLTVEVLNPKYTIVKSYFLRLIKNQKSKLNGEFIQKTLINL